MLKFSELKKKKEKEFVTEEKKNRGIFENIPFKKGEYFRIN
jgi:hypothetical protein